MSLLSAFCGAGREKFLEIQTRKSSIRAFRAVAEKLSDVLPISSAAAMNSYFARSSLITAS